MANLDNKYLIITSWIIELKDVTANQKMLLGALDTLSRKEGYCWATDKALSECSGVNYRTIQRALEQLEDLGYVIRKTDYSTGSPERHITVINAQNAYAQNARSINAQNARHDNTLTHIDLYREEKPKPIAEILEDLLSMESWHFIIIRELCKTKAEKEKANPKKWIKYAVGELELEGIEFSTLKEVKMRVARIIRARKRDAKS